LHRGTCCFSHSRDAYFTVRMPKTAAQILGSRCGGLSLIDMDQGFDQLTLFIAHLMLEGKNARLILSFISHLQ
jgi:hypothetical protein